LNPWAKDWLEQKVKISNAKINNRFIHRAYAAKAKTLEGCDQALEYFLELEQ
jgi:hypothetical protein